MHDEKEMRRQMDAIIDETKEAVVDAFAEFMGFVNERKYDDAALAAHGMAYTLSLFSRGLATEALARRVGGVDKSE